MTVDAVVVGAGPTGLMLACESGTCNSVTWSPAVSTFSASRKRYPRSSVPKEDVDYVTVFRCLRRFVPLLADAARFARHGAW